MNSLTVVYTTSRENPCIEWFFDSLRNQGGTVDEIIVVDLMADQDERRVQFRSLAGRDIIHTLPKPTVWQGKHKLTKTNWWAKSNALNTALCLCRTEWIAFVDDRSVLLPGWTNHVQSAMKGHYAIFGAYEKRTDMTVDHGVIKNAGIVTGQDSRERYVLTQRNGQAPTGCPGEWCFGCNLALPLEWCLQVNGFEELCDGLSVEDVIFGAMLSNNGFDLRYDLRMKIIEDRTPSELGIPMQRSSKERFPNDVQDKGHAALKRFTQLKQTQHQWNLRQLRSHIRIHPWPVPTLPDRDWHDNQPLHEMQ